MSYKLVFTSDLLLPEPNAPEIIPKHQIQATKRDTNTKNGNSSKLTNVTKGQR